MGCFNGWEKTIGWEPCKGVRNTPQTWKHFQDSEQQAQRAQQAQQAQRAQQTQQAQQALQAQQVSAFNEFTEFDPLCPARLPLPCSALLYFTLVYVLCFALRWSTYSADLLFFTLF